MANSNASLFQNWQRTPTTYNTMQAPNTSIVKKTAPYTPPKTTQDPVQQIVEQVVQQVQESSTPSNVTGYTAPATRASANISIPDYSWSPTGEQLANWLMLGGQQAETEAAPQRTSLTTGLERYTTAAGEAKTSANKQYTDQELSLANIVKNTMLKAAEENAIRRGAETSGWLGGQQQDIGRYETEQRAGIKNTASDYYNQLANAVLAKTQETNDLLTELERVKGLRTNVVANQLQQNERTNVFNEKQADFSSQIAKGSMINSEEAQAAMNAYNNAALAAQIENTKWQQGFSEQQAAADAAQQSFQNNLLTSNANKTVAAAPTYTWNGISGLSLSQYLNQLNQTNKTNTSNLQTTTDSNGTEYYWDGNKWVQKSIFQ